MHIGLRVAQGVSGLGQVHRRHLAIGLLGTNALQAGHDVASDADATQHQGFQLLDGHCRPPANIKEKRRPAPRRVIGGNTSK
jgi:hypothetical protein